MTKTWKINIIKYLSIYIICIYVCVYLYVYSYILRYIQLLCRIKVDRGKSIYVDEFQYLDELVYIFESKTLNV